jgi:hypothetical protein
VPPSPRSRRAARGFADDAGALRAPPGHPDRHHVGEVEHVDLLQLRGGAELRVITYSDTSASSVTAASPCVVSVEQRGRGHETHRMRRHVQPGAFGRTLAEEATTALNEASFGLPGLTPDQAAQVTAALYLVRAATGDVAPDAVASARPGGEDG